ncbi:hypothetical protein Q9L58_010138 [Maublancomyces gigas]|uniref:Uncharacterized protein n=1 Tax=Discina gigas TaxID=1032678 RepID=A0ABR3G502_9PEZI
MGDEGSDGGLNGIHLLHEAEDVWRALGFEVVDFRYDGSQSPKGGCLLVLDIGRGPMAETRDSLVLVGGGDSEVLARFLFEGQQPLFGEEGVNMGAKGGATNGFCGEVV